MAKFKEEAAGVTVDPWVLHCCGVMLQPALEHLDSSCVASVIGDIALLWSASS